MTVTFPERTIFLLGSQHFLLTELPRPRSSFIGGLRVEKKAKVIKKKTLRPEDFEEVKLLHDRLKYLNDLRLKVAQFYVAAIGAFFASSAIISHDAFWKAAYYAGIPVLFVGVTVLRLDARLRGRIAATTIGIMLRKSEPEKIPDDSFHTKFLTDITSEDSLFGLIIAIVNASVAVILLVSFLLYKSKPIRPPILVVVFFLLVVVQAVMWSISEGKWRKGDEWPAL